MNRSLVLLLPFLLVVLPSCTDSGSNPLPAPVIDELRPGSVAVADTLHILGNWFGAEQGASIASIGSVRFTSFTLWSPTEIEAIVPAGAVTGNVVVTVGGAASNGMLLVVQPGAGGLVSFSGTVQPILNTGCALSGCHLPPSPASGFDQSTYAGVRAGGSKFGTSVVVPGDSSGSRIIQAMRGTAPGLGRMPFGGPWVTTGVPEEDIQAIARWIQEGALEN